MKRVISATVVLTLLVGLVLTGASCTTTEGAKTGTIEVRVTDAPAEWDVISVLITIANVAIYKAEDGKGEWVPLTITGTNPFDFLQIKSLEEVLAIDEVAAGRYTQARLIIGNIKVILEGEKGMARDLNDEYKFISPFEVIEGETTTLLFDFNVTTTVLPEFTMILKPDVQITLSVRQGESQ